MTRKTADHQASFFAETRGGLVAAPSIHQSPTSVAASKAIAPRCDSLISKVEDAFELAGGAGLTDEELFTGLRRSGAIGSCVKESTIRARRCELASGKIRKVRDSGLTRPGVSGLKMCVWVRMEASK